MYSMPSSGLQKLHAQSGAGTYLAPKLYWGAQNIGHIVTICCMVSICCMLFAFTFMLLMWQMKKHMRKRSVNMVSSSVLFMFVKK